MIKNGSDIVIHISPKLKVQKRCPKFLYVSLDHRPWRCEREFMAFTVVSKIIHSILHVQIVTEAD